MMKWIEIIELRTGNTEDKELESVFRELIRDLKLEHELTKIKVYHNYTVDCDYSIHLVHHRLSPEEGGSTLGLRIASILKTFGLVSHNTWIEQKEMLRQTQQMHDKKEITSKENE